jgi:hypothetical protein
MIRFACASRRAAFAERAADSLYCAGIDAEPLGKRAHTLGASGRPAYLRLQFWRYPGPPSYLHSALARLSPARTRFLNDRALGATTFSVRLAHLERLIAHVLTV